MKNFALLILLSVALAGTLSADTILCSAVTQWSQLTPLDRSCTDDDKLYSNFTGNLPATMQVDIGQIPTTETHFQSIGRLTSPLTAGTWTWGYTITVLSANRTIYRVGLDVTQGGTPGTTATVNITGGHVLQSITGSSDSEIVMLPSLDVSNTMVIPTGAVVTSITTTFEQIATPEPATLGIMGVALIGLAFLRRRKA